MSIRLTCLSLALAAAALATACATASGPRATATLVPTTGNNVTGTVRFLQSSGKVIVTGEVRGLKPGGEHGFHVHEKGDCSSGDGESAGGHFNPTGQPHAAHSAGMHHAGDLPSLKADMSGRAEFQFESTSIAVGSGVTDVVGKGLIVHANPDDFRTQPTGNAGARLACAPILKG